MPCGWGLQARRGPDACGRATQSCGRNEIRARGGCFDGNAGAQGGGGPRRGRGEAGSLAAGLGPRGGRRHLAGAQCASGAARVLSVPRLRRGAVPHHGAADAAGSRGVVPQGHGRLGQAQTDPHPARPRPGGVRPRQRRRPPGAATAARHAAQRGLLLGLQRGAHRRAGRCGGLAGAGAGGRHGPAVCGCGRVHGGRALAMGRCVAHHLGLEGNCAGGGGRGRLGAAGHAAQCVSNAVRQPPAPVSGCQRGRLRPGARRGPEPGAGHHAAQGACTQRHGPAKAPCRCGPPRGRAAAASAGAGPPHAAARGDARGAPAPGAFAAPCGGRHGPHHRAAAL